MCFYPHLFYLFKSYFTWNYLKFWVTLSVGAAACIYKNRLSKKLNLEG